MLLAGVAPLGAIAPTVAHSLPGPDVVSVPGQYFRQIQDLLREFDL